MKWMEQQSRYENAAYAALWGLLFAAPVLSLWVRTASDANISFDWQEILVVWRQFGVYLLLFLIHNFVLAPMLVYGRKRWLYVLLTLCMVGLFSIYQCSHRPDDFMHQRRPPMEMHDKHQPSMEMRDNRPPMEMHDDRPPMDEAFNHEPPPFEHRPGEPPAFIGQHDIIAIVVLILMCGMNLGVKLYFRSRKDQKKLVQLQKENLEQQLEYLKYQINPHFFMNTLNNIHALVDIDPEKAKETILELSKMMRFVLYEGNKQGVPLSREFDFIRNYITLMRLRYTDKVRIDVDLPNEVPDRQIPPLMLITFIENAFKHGISYQHESFIEAKVVVENDELRFSCRNSKSEKSNEEKGGVGLANVRKRLHLLYASNYTLNIHNGADTYSVELNIPLS